MRKTLIAIVAVTVCLFGSGCRREAPKKKPVDFTQTVTIPAKRGF